MKRLLFQNCNKDSDNICKKPLVNKIDCQITFKLGGEPTDAKAHLPELKPPMTTMLKKAIQDTVKSTADENNDNPLPEELELLRIKQDMVIEYSEIIAYKSLIEMAQRMPELDINVVVPLLNII